MPTDNDEEDGAPVTHIRLRTAHHNAPIGSAAAACTARAPSAEPKPRLAYRCGQCSSPVAASLANGWPQYVGAVHCGQCGTTTTVTINQTFGLRVRAGRHRLGLTLRALASKAGIHWTYLGQVERGERNVSLHTILAIARALGIGGEVLLRGLPHPEAAGHPPT